MLAAGRLELSQLCCAWVQLCVVLLLINTSCVCHRDSVVEILFEQDNEETSVATLILDSLVQVFLY